MFNHISNNKIINYILYKVAKVVYYVSKGLIKCVKLINNAIPNYYIILD